MGRHFQNDLDQINSDLFSLFGHVEKMIDLAVKALCDRKPELVEKVIDMDEHVDLKEVAIEEEGLKILAAAREETGLAVVTEVMGTADVDLVAKYADVLQIGARNMTPHVTRRG